MFQNLAFRSGFTQKASMQTLRTTQMSGLRNKQVKQASSVLSERAEEKYMAATGQHPSQMLPTGSHVMPMTLTVVWLQFWEVVHVGVCFLACFTTWPCAVSSGS